MSTNRAENALISLAYGRHADEYCRVIDEIVALTTIVDCTGDWRETTSGMNPYKSELKGKLIDLAVGLIVRFDGDSRVSPSPLLKAAKEHGSELVGLALGLYRDKGMKATVDDLDAIRGFMSRDERAALKGQMVKSAVVKLKRIGSLDKNCEDVRDYRPLNAWIEFAICAVVAYDMAVSGRIEIDREELCDLPAGRAVSAAWALRACSSVSDYLNRSFLAGRERYILP